MTWTFVCLMVSACTCVCLDVGATICLLKDGLCFGRVRTNESGEGMGMNEMVTCVIFTSILLIRTMPSPGRASDVYHALGPTGFHLPSTPSFSHCIEPNPTVDVERPHGWLHVVVPPRALACACLCFFVCVCLSKSWFPPFLPPSTPFIFCPPFLCYLVPLHPCVIFCHLFARGLDHGSRSHPHQRTTNSTCVCCVVALCCVVLRATPTSA